MAIAMNFGGNFGGGDALKACFPNANGVLAASAATDGAALASKAPVLESGKLSAIGWTSDAGDATTVLGIFINGVLKQTVPLPAAIGALNMPAISVTEGMFVSVDFHSGTAPGNLNVWLAG